jgi:hypothetical protein
MDPAVPYAADEQMRVEALRAAASFLSGRREQAVATDALEVADTFLSWLLNEPEIALPNAVLEGSD